MNSPLSTICVGLDEEKLTCQVIINAPAQTSAAGGFSPNTLTLSEITLVTLRISQACRAVTDKNVFRSLLYYMRSATARQGLAYAETPTRMSGGFDATILGFS